MAAPDDPLFARAARCRVAIAAYEEQLGAERERRQAIICEMRDRGISWSRIAAAIGLSPSHCSTIVAEAPEPVTVQ